MLRRIRQVFWALFWLALAPEAVKLALHLMHDRQARIGAFALLCAFGGILVTTLLVRPTRIVYREPVRSDW